MNRRSRATAALAVTAAVLTASEVAQATIRPQRGIAGVAAGMTATQVRGVLGAPASVRRGSNDFGRYREFRYRDLHVFFQGVQRVTSVSTTRRGERTRSGIGVGSSERRLRRKMRGVRCATELRVRRCTLGRLLPGRRVTDFLIRRGRVVRVSIGLVID